MYEGCKGLLGPLGCLIVLVLWLLSVSLGWGVPCLSAMPEGERAELGLSVLLGRLWPASAPFGRASASFTYDCKPFLRLLLLLECICAACRCAEQLMCAMVVCSLDTLGPERACMASILQLFACCRMA